VLLDHGMYRRLDPDFRRGFLFFILHSYYSYVILIFDHLKMRWNLSISFFWCVLGYCLLWKAFINRDSKLGEQVLYKYLHLPPSFFSNLSLLLTYRPTNQDNVFYEKKKRNEREEKGIYDHILFIFVISLFKKLVWWVFFKEGFESHSKWIWLYKHGASFNLFYWFYYVNHLHSLFFNIKYRWIYF